MRTSHRRGRIWPGLLLAAAMAFGAVVAAPPAAAATAKITLSPGSGPAGTSIVVTGAGFAKKAAGTVALAASSVRFTTSAAGAFSVAITVPLSASGATAVTATAGRSRAVATFTVTPRSPSISSARLRFGVSTPGGASATAELDAVAVAAGESPSIVLSYKDFSQAAPLDELRRVAARGATSLVTWEPWRWGGGSPQTDHTNARVAAGAFDAYLRQWGAALAGWGETVYLRYGHEMNGDWYPWADGVGTNAAGSYVEAWRHVHELLRAEGATNVKWVWSPNVPYPGSTPLSSLYPGADYVDVVALDGYNWGTAVGWSSWTAPDALFADGMSELRALAPGKPILIAETGSAEAGGSKADWITALVAYLNGQPDVQGFVWFDHDKEVDWRISSSAASAAAFRGALAARR